jgi:hypothetical protein
LPGAPGADGAPGPNEIGGLPIDAATATDGDILQLLTGAWRNTPPALTAAQAADLTDAGDSVLHYHAADRALANATGTLAVANGGTGAGSFTAGRLLIGNGTGAITEDANLFWDNTNKRLGIGTSSPLQALDILDSSPTNLIVRKSGSTGMSFSANWPTLALNMRYDASQSQWRAIGAGYTGKLEQKPTTGLMSFSIQNTNASADQLLGSYTGVEHLTISSGGNVGIGFGTAATQKLQVAGNVVPNATGSYDLGTSSLGWRQLFLDYTNTATVGNVTINKASGTVNLAALGTTLTLTNSLIATTSRIMLTLASDPGSAIGSLYAVPAAGSCTINVTTAVTNQTKIAFEVIN